MDEKEKQEQEKQNEEKLKKLQELKNDPDFINSLREIVMNQIYIDAVINNVDIDLCKEPYVFDKFKLAKFKKAIEILQNLKEQGKLTFEISDLKKPTIFHVITVTWKLKNDMFVVINDSNKKEISDLFSCIDECLIEEDSANVWQLSSEIYKEIH